MKECVYCGKEIDRNGIYFCSKCKKKIEKLGYINTGNVMSDWTAQAYWYLEENGGNYWRNLSDFKDPPKEEQELMGKLNFIRPIDYIRFDAYRKYLGKDVMEFPMSAENLNNMEKWYLELAKKERIEKHTMPITKAYLGELYDIMNENKEMPDGTANIYFCIYCKHFVFGEDCEFDTCPYIECLEELKKESGEE